MAKFKIKLGVHVKDKVTGYKGIVTGRHEWLYGCLTYTVQAQKLHDGKPVSSQGFDEERLELIKQKHKAKKPTGGGPASTPAPVCR